MTRMTRMNIGKLLFLGILMATGNASAQFSISDEYSMMGYEGMAMDNPVARLQEKLVSGEVELEYDSERGYLESLLDELGIDTSSQMLVFSPTSLQHKLISPETPRALYFNDETYIGFVQNSSIVEVTTVDERFGIVFYTFDNAPKTEEYFERANQTCLVCHDTQGTMGGGVPMLMALSSIYSERNVPLKNYSGIGNVEDDTPIVDRWGGWYVTGRHGLQAHLGNLRLESADDLAMLDDYRIWNVETLDGYMDTSLWPESTSDIVALMVLEHQVTVQNQLTYIKFKAPAVLMRRGLSEAANAGSWAELPEAARETLTRMMDRLVRKLVMMDYAELQSTISGKTEYVEWFEAQGPRDPRGRTLREFDLTDSLFEYPLSYLVYTADFDTLPAYAKDYVYQRLAAYLGGQEIYENDSQFSLEDRQAALEILVATKPDFLPYVTSGELPEATAAIRTGTWQ